ncbi:MAG: hypothetical protein H0S85_05865 [Desulfovibrionaceae bacterium]|jgi:hypothetical protein|nr:hypothetical protein [Desulfovibrionaceae bacterium]
MDKRKTLRILFGLYPILCLLPYFAQGLNSPDPWIGPLPFTVAYAVFLVVYGCAVLYVAATSIWKEDEGKGEKI